MNNVFKSIPGWAYVALFLGAVLIALFFKATWTDGDEGRYLLLAKAIAEGHGQTETHLPEPAQEWLTPPLYPHILGLIYRVQPSIVVLKAFSAVSYLAFAIAFLVYISRQRYSPYVSVAVFVIGALTVFSLYFSWMIFSEALFMLWVMLFLLYMGQYHEKQGMASLVLSAFCAGSSVLIRPVGLALIGAGCLTLATRLRWRSLILFLGIALLVNVPTIWRTMDVLGVPFAYMAHFGSEGRPGGLFTAVEQMMHSVIVLLPQHFFNGLPRVFFFSFFDGHCLLCRLGLEFAIPVLKAVISVWVLMGWLYRMWTRRSAAEWLFFIFWPLISTYHVHLTRGIESRYFLPVLPLAAVYLYEGLRLTAHVIYKWKPRMVHRELISTSVIMGMALYVLSASAVVGAIRIRNAWQTRAMSSWDPERFLIQESIDQKAFGRYIEVARWAATHTPSNAVIVSRKPMHTYLISNRKSHRYDQLHGYTGIWHTITAYAFHRQVYVLEDSFSVASGYGKDRLGMLLPAMRAHSNELHLVYESSPPTTRLWQVDIQSTESSGEKIAEREGSE